MTGIMAGAEGAAISAEAGESGMPETYRYKDRKKLRCGYTTGACAAAAAGAAARILVSGEILSRVQLQLPGGQSL